MSGCQNKDTKYPLSILERKFLKSIPSGSGIVIKNDTAYIIGDDATGIYRSSLKDYQVEKIAVNGLDFTNHREPKTIKRDFESGTLVTWKGNEYFLAFGSGSKSTTRDSLLMFSTSDPSDNKIISLNKYYSQLQHYTKSDTTEWNIEGATVTQDFLILLNRGNNMILKINKNEFMTYLMGESSIFPGIEFQRIKLPAVKNHEARLSGICTLNNEQIIFSASVEDTPDWINDGPVLGSFIGTYSLTKNTVTACHLLRSDTGMILKEKIESLDILHHIPGESVIIVAIGDNDNGSSVLYRLKLAL